MRMVQGLSRGIVFAVMVCGSVVAQQARNREAWVGSWASAQQIPEPANALPPDDLRDATLRQVIHLSLGGARMRVHVSNVFGTKPLRIDSVHVARPTGTALGAIDVASDATVTFAGATTVVIPAGAEYVSDPLPYAVKPLSDLSITMHLPEPPAQETSHPGSRETSFLVHGNAVNVAELPAAKRFDHWFFLSAVDVPAPADAYAVVTFGDSITDGHGATTNGNDRWPDGLATRLNAAAIGRRVGVLNVGIGGNHLLTDGLGPNALARFDRDVLAQSGVRTVVMLEGVNDLGGLAQKGNATVEQHAELVAAIEAAYEQMIVRAHSHGLRVIGGTITPYVGSDFYHPTAADESDRVSVNAWIRAKGHFDAVVDFDAVMRDPAHADRLLPAYDSGDHLHPSPAGYRAMAAAVASMF
jgi:lysophospholipase L1-like esterase